jgi:hypothetical protein
MKGEEEEEDTSRARRCTSKRKRSYKAKDEGGGGGGHVRCAVRQCTGKVHPKINPLGLCAEHKTVQEDIIKFMEEQAKAKDGRGRGGRGGQVPCAMRECPGQVYPTLNEVGVCTTHHKKLKKDIDQFTQGQQRAALPRYVVEAVEEMKERLTTLADHVGQLALTLREITERPPPSWADQAASIRVAPEDSPVSASDLVANFPLRCVECGLGIAEGLFCSNCLEQFIKQ